MKLAIVSGVEGTAVYLNDFRIAGPKPWGGGKIVRSWDIAPEDLESAIEDWFKRKCVSRAGGSMSQCACIAEDAKRCLRLRSRLTDAQFEALDRDDNECECACHQNDGEEYDEEKSRV